jgi:hypothetical protein
MSEVYSFRLSSDNSREAEAAKIIKAWENKGLSLRHIITQALLVYQENEDQWEEINIASKHLKEMILELHDSVFSNNDEQKHSLISSNFKDAVKRFAKRGVALVK